jgi:hypothetical protein
MLRPGMLICFHLTRFVAEFFMSHELVCMPGYIFLKKIGNLLQKVVLCSFGQVECLGAFVVGARARISARRHAFV